MQKMQRWPALSSPCRWRPPPPSPRTPPWPPPPPPPRTPPWPPPTSSPPLPLPTLPSCQSKASLSHPTTILILAGKHWHQHFSPSNIWLETKFALCPCEKMLSHFFKGWGPIEKLLPLVDSFFLSTNEKPLFFPNPFNWSPNTAFWFWFFLFEWREQRYWQLDQVDLACRTLEWNL